MNIAFFLKPKVSVSYLFSDFTVRQSLEKMHNCGYTAIPVINRDGKYVGTVSEGDFLWFFTSCIKNKEDINEKTIEEIPLSKIIRTGVYNPVSVTAEIDELINISLNQNFVPVVDDLGSFIGIITRRNIIKHLVDKTQESKKTLTESPYVAINQ